MFQRRVNLLLVLFSIIGGVAGFLAGEALLMWGEGRIPHFFLMGLYFGQLALWVAFFCLLAEYISPEINGKGWRLRNGRDGWKLLVPASLVLLLVAGIALQFVYGLYFGKVKPPQDILIAIDTSGSMLETDPDQVRLQAIRNLVQSLEPDKRVAIIAFNDRAEVLQSLTPVADQAMKDEVLGLLDNMPVPDGGTDIAAALTTSMGLISDASNDGRNSTVILISDGYSEVDLDQALSPYQAAKVGVHAIGMNMENQQGNNLLKWIANRTGGTFYEVDEVQSLSGVVTQIYRSTQTWHLVGERMGALADSLYYAIVRVGCIVIIGALMGLGAGSMFDNRYLVRSYLVGGAIGGLLAGIILELGLQGAGPEWPAYFYRGVADVLLAIVLSLSTLLVAYKQSSSLDGNDSMYFRNRGYGGRSQNTRETQGTHRDFN